MRIAIIGAGSIGGFIAAALARAGVEVCVVARGEHLAAIARDGLSVDSDLGRFTVTVPAAADARDLPDADVLLLTFKSHQWAPLLEQLAPAAARGASVVTLQNGVPYWYVREPPLQTVDPQGRIGRLFSDAQTIGGVVHVSGHVAAPGVIKQSGGVRYMLGNPSDAGSPLLETLIETMQSAGLRAEFDPDVRATVWLKLVNNVGLNTVGALRGLTVGQVLRDGEARAQTRDLMREALDVGIAMGVVAGADIEARMNYAARLDDVKTSMLQDVERGRALELEPIQGAAIELAQRYGVAIPNLRAAYPRLQALSAGNPK